MISTLAISNYRSLRNLVMPLKQLNVITGPNGSGKSSVYRALRLLAETARNGVISSLAREGGLQSTLWAGPESFSKEMLRGEHPIQGTRRKKPVSLQLGFASEELSYAIDLGLAASNTRSAFFLDPKIRRECLWGGIGLRPSTILADRRGAVVKIRDFDGEWHTVPRQLSNFDSMMTQLADPRSAPELLLLREQIRSWRFYDHFRTDADSPARLPQIGTFTPVLANDGGDMAAALQTIIEIGDADRLHAAVEDAFPGASIAVMNNQGRFEIAMHQHGLLRPLGAAELSDGTIRYLLWIAALLTPRPPGLLVLNEPETSLHPDLLPALGRLIVSAAKHTQLIVVSHASRLVATLEQEDECNSIRLEKEFGETRMMGTHPLDAPSWHWPPG